MEVTGLILAGGMSSRFGSDKAQAMYQGRSFILVAYQLLKSICADVVISGWDHNLNIDGLVCLPDITPGGGPMSGIATAVCALQSPWLLIIPCDMPLLTDEVLFQTIEGCNNDDDKDYGKTVVWQWPDGSIQPFPMLLNRLEASKAIDLLGMHAGMSIKSMLGHIPYKALQIPPQKERLFSNINTQSEFENLQL